MWIFEGALWLASWVFKTRELNCWSVEAFAGVFPNRVFVRKWRSRDARLGSFALDTVGSRPGFVVSVDISGLVL